jgi:hypothetical protein
VAFGRKLEFDNVITEGGATKTGHIVKNRYADINFVGVCDQLRWF